MWIYVYNDTYRFMSAIYVTGIMWKPFMGNVFFYFPHNQVKWIAFLVLSPLLMMKQGLEGVKIICPRTDSQKLC